MSTISNHAKNFACALAFIFACEVAFSQNPPTSNPATGKLELNLSLLDQKINFKDLKFQVNVELTNNTDKDQEVYDLTLDERVITFTFKYKNGAEHTPFQYSLLTCEPGTETRILPATVMLQKGKSLSRAFKFVPLFPGNLELEAKMKIPGSSEEVASNKVNLQIEGKGELYLKFRLEERATAGEPAEKSQETYTVQLFPDACPEGVEYFATIVQSGFYEGLNIFQIIKNGWVRAGCPSNKGTDGWVNSLKRPASTGVSFEEGSLALCTYKGNYCSSQFFIGLKPLSYLTGKFPIIGKLDADSFKAFNSYFAKLSIDIDFTTDSPRKTISLVDVTLTTEKGK